jgi:hypothetical protein
MRGGGCTGTATSRGCTCTRAARRDARLDHRLRRGARGLHAGVPRARPPRAARMHRHRRRPAARCPLDARAPRRCCRRSIASTSTPRRTRARSCTGARRGRRCRDLRHELRGQGDLLHAAGRGCQRRPAGRVLPLRRLQPVVGTREATAPGGVPVLRHRLRRHRRPRRRALRRCVGAGATHRRVLAARGTRVRARWSCSPAASRCCNSTRR